MPSAAGWYSAIAAISAILPSSTNLVRARRPAPLLPISDRLSSYAPSAAVSIMLLTAALGAYDDSRSLIGSSGAGLRARTKFVLLGSIALIAAIALYHPAALGIDYL